MGLVSTLSTGAPYHLLVYSLVFGASTYQSFFSGIVAFRVLPYKEFARLQHKIFPPYFGFQVITTATLLLTHPGTSSMSQAGYTSLGIALVGSLINSLVLGPKNNKVLSKRLDQCELEGKSHKDPTASDTMKQLNRQFGKLHGISVLVNLAVWGSLLTYGIDLTETLVNLA